MEEFDNIKNLDDFRRYINNKKLVDNNHENIINEFVNYKINMLKNEIYEKTKHIKNKKDRQITQILLLDEYISNNIIYDTYSFEYYNNYKNKYATKEDRDKHDPLKVDDVNTNDFEGTLGFRKLGFCLGKAVCKSITYISSQILYELGIDNIPIRSDVEGFGHIWNIVNIDGEEIMIDFTASMSLKNYKDGKIDEKYKDIVVNFSDNIKSRPFVLGINKLFKKDQNIIKEIFNKYLNRRINLLISDDKSINEDLKKEIIDSLEINVCYPTFNDYKLYSNNKISNNNEINYDTFVPCLSFIDNVIYIYPYGNELWKLKNIDEFEKFLETDKFKNYIDYELVKYINLYKNSYNIGNQDKLTI